MTSALKFNSDADRLRSLSPVPQSKFTITGWINSAAAQAEGVYVALQGNTDLLYDAFVITGTEAKLRPPFPAFEYSMHPGPLDVLGGTWYFFAISHDINDAFGVNDFTLFGPSGALLFDQTVVGHFGAFTATQFWIGGCEIGGPTVYRLDEGGIKDVKVWNRKLTQAEAEAEAVYREPQLLTDLWAYYPLDPGPDMLLDTSGNDRHLTNPSGTGTWGEIDGPEIEDAPPEELDPVVSRYARTLKQLLPPGKIRDNIEPDSVLSKTMIAAAGEFARIDGRGEDLIDETDPRTADETIEDWERILGLPDEQVLEIPATLAERRVAITQKYISRGGQSSAYFIALALACGYVVTISTAAVLRVGFRVGARVYGAGFAYSMEFTVQDPGGVGALSHADFERVIRGHTHSHITVIFSYV